MVLLMRNPHYFTKIIDEFKQVFNTDDITKINIKEELTMEKLEGLKLLNMCWLESLRMVPVTYYSLYNRVHEDI